MQIKTQSLENGRNLNLTEEQGELVEQLDDEFSWTTKEKSV